MATAFLDVGLCCDRLLKQNTETVNHINRPVRMVNFVHNFFSCPEKYYVCHSVTSLFCRTICGPRFEKINDLCPGTEVKVFYIFIKFGNIKLGGSSLEAVTTEHKCLNLFWF